MQSDDFQSFDFLGFFIFFFIRFEFFSCLVCSIKLGRDTRKIGHGKRNEKCSVTFLEILIFWYFFLI